MDTRTLKEGERITKKSIFHLIILGLIKSAAGLITGMGVIIADAISTFADILGVFASYFGLRLSRKAADKKFEYGYYKIETFTAFLISLGIIYAGYIIIRENIAVIKNPIEGHYRPFAITTTIIAIIHSYKLAKKLEYAGKKVNSLSLIANAKDKKVDIFAGIIILVSIIANYQKIPYIEGIVTIIIAIFILKVGIFSAKESLFFLLDYWDDPILIRKVRKIFKKEKDLVLNVRKLRFRRAGTFVFGEAFIEINPYAGIQDLREELDLLQEKIKALNPYIKDFSIYTHISQLDNVKVAVPIRGGSGGLNAKVASTLKKTYGYLFAEISGGKIKKYHIKKLREEERKPVELADFLKKEKVNIVINSKLHSLIYYNLRRVHHIFIYPSFAGVKNVKQALKLLMIDI